MALLISVIRHRERWDLRRSLGMWLFVFWGLANAAAISLGRTGHVASSPFQSRYHAFTLWFHLGVLVLLFLAQGKAWRVLRRVWVPVVCYGWLTGFLQGMGDARRDFNRGSRPSTSRG